MSRGAGRISLFHTEAPYFNIFNKSYRITTFLSGAGILIPAATSNVARSETQIFSTYEDNLLRNFVTKVAELELYWSVLEKIFQRH